MKTKTLNIGLVFIALTVLMFASVKSVYAQSGTWTNKAPMGTASYGLGGAFVGGKFYAISGFATARLEIYSPTLNTWTTGAPVPADSGFNLRQYAGTTVLDGKIYVVGGDTGGSGDRATLLRYDPALNTWTTLAPMPLGARYGLGAAAMNGKLYAVGGTTVAGGTALNRVEEYDPASNTWATKASMPTAHFGPLVGAIAGKLYVAGGSDTSGPTTATHVYDPSLNTWSTNAPMPFTGNGNGVVLNGKLFSIGAGPSPEQRVFAYDPAANSWNTNFALMPTGRRDLGVGSDDFNNKIYAIGGYASGSASTTLEVFTAPLPPALTNLVLTPVNPTIVVTSNQQFTATGSFSDGSSHSLIASGNSWTVKAPMSTASYGLSGAFVGGKFYAISGFATARLEIYSPTLNTWTTGAPVPADTGFNLRQYAGTAVLDGKVYVVGGDTGGSGDRATLLRYDPALNTWTTLAPMPLGARYGLGAAAMNGKLYAVGGTTVAGATALNRVEEYDPASNTWTTKASMPTAHYSPLVGAIGGKLYVAGGSDASGPTTATHVYDPSLNTWSTNAPMPFTGYGSGTVLNGKLFSIGAGPSPEQRVFAYDPAANSWNTNFALMPTGRHDLGVAADEFNNKIYAVGGYNGGTLTTLEVFTPPGEIIWSSSATGIASINTNGLATGLSVGSTTIIATAGNLAANTLLAVVTQPAITNQPMNVTVGANGTATFTAGASGGSLSYQWQFNGTNITGATGASLTITNVSSANIGAYKVIVNNAAGSVTSRAVTLATVDIKLFAGVIVNGPLGSNYVIQATSNLLSSWTTLTNVALPTQPYVYIDYSSPTNRQQFYRAVPQ